MFFFFLGDVVSASTKPPSICIRGTAAARWVETSCMTQQGRSSSARPAARARRQDGLATTVELSQAVTKTRRRAAHLLALLLLLLRFARLLALAALFRHLADLGRVLGLHKRQNTKRKGCEPGPSRRGTCSEPQHSSAAVPAVPPFAPRSACSTRPPPSCSAEGAGARQLQGWRAPLLVPVVEGRGGGKAATPLSYCGLQLMAAEPPDRRFLLPSAGPSHFSKMCFFC